MHRSIALPEQRQLRDVVMTGAELLDLVVSCDGCADEAPSLCHVHEQIARQLEARATAKIGQSGRSISAECSCGEGKNPLHALLKSHDSPNSNKTGRSRECRDPACLVDHRRCPRCLGQKLEPACTYCGGSGKKPR
jgi:hypothetical protein